MINPIPIFSRDSRYWLIRRTSRLLVPGTSPVGFTDFWLGDQFCSLAFSLTHLYTMGCAYSHHWDGVFTNCGSTTHWITLAFLATPYASRLVQSVRRYYDSGLPTHLVNARKYFSSIVTYVTYYTWKSRGAPHDKTFAVWLAFATISSIYTSLWDLLMDWSFLQRHSTHRFLRSELIYSNNPFIYYFAIITNVMIRFIWVINIPVGGLNPRVRAVIVAGLEMLRRFQWNFYRLENEQIGNTDQYRATREVPLPYSSMHRADNEDDSDSDIEGHAEHHANGGNGAYRGDGISLHMSKILEPTDHNNDSPTVSARRD
ncbi:EXS-domain-containing protein [Hysterangium stoloniferum]|nr:EXS-domain-containing protein [Hysterangium stoloniferum]